MAIFGWLCLAVLTFFACSGMVLALIGSIGLSGKLGGEFGLIAVLCAILLTVCYRTFPFVIAVAQ